MAKIFVLFLRVGANNISYSNVEVDSIREVIEIADMASNKSEEMIDSALWNDRRQKHF